VADTRAHLQQAQISRHAFHNSMELQSPLENKFGFLRAQFDFSYRVPRFDVDLAFYSGSILSHYTDLNGFLGIVESAGFWLSDHRFLNDTQEFEDGRNLTIRLLRRMADKKRYVNFRAVLINVATTLEKHKENPYYVCSFSKIPDSLDQWRAYGQIGTGIFILFRNSPDGLNPFNLPPILVSRKVVYRDQAKAKILLVEIRKYALEYQADLAHGNNICEGDWVSQMATWLSMKFINLKHEAYASEQEVRLILPSDHVDKFHGIKHRAGKYGIVPYVSTSDWYRNHLRPGSEPFRLPIQEVRVGPAANQDALIQSIEVFLANKGYGSVLVRKSDVPFRG
jgi:Protein of unknown function (DUF2971)